MLRRIAAPCWFIALLLVVGRTAHAQDGPPLQVDAAPPAAIPTPPAAAPPPTAPTPATTSAPPPASPPAPAATTTAPPTTAPPTAATAVPVVPTPKTVIDAIRGTSTRDHTVFAIKVIIGLIALVVVAYLGGHRRVVRFQERLGIVGVITAGFPFVMLGVIASQPSIGVLADDVVEKLYPVLHFGLGWLGFIIGAQLDIRVLDRVPTGTAYLVIVEALGPFAIVAGGCAVVMIAFGMSVSDPALWRDVVLMGTAAAMTAPRKFRGLANRAWREGRGVDVLLGQLDELVSIVGLLIVTAFFRTHTSSTWQLPDTAWIFVSLGLGVAVGVLIFAMIRVPVSDPEFLAIVLGGIAFASGLARYLQLSPIVICFVAGVLVTNFPNEQRDSVFRILRHLERAVHLMFLIVVGAWWDIGDWRGWVLVPIFVGGRALGKWLGIVASKISVGAQLPAGFADRRNLITPMSAFSIALVISIEPLSRDPGLSWFVSLVIGGSIVTELLIQRVGPVATDRRSGEIGETTAAPPPPVAVEQAPSSNEGTP